MTEHLPSQGHEVKKVSQTDKLWKELQAEEQNTKDIYNASKILRFFSSLAGHTEFFIDGKTNPDFALTGIAAVALLPYVIEKSDMVMAALAVSIATSSLGLAAFSEKKLSKAWGSEKRTNKWINEWILNKDKPKIDEKDIFNVLINIPSTSLTSPEEMHSWLEKDSDTKKKKDPRDNVLNYVHGVIRVENRYRNLDDEQKIEREKEEAISLMLKGEIMVRQEMRTNKYLAKKALVMGMRAGVGAVAGAAAALGIYLYWGSSQCGGPVAVIDDSIFFTSVYLYNPAKENIKNAIHKIKKMSLPSVIPNGWEKLQEKQQKKKTPKV